MKKTFLLIPALALGAFSASAAIVYTQPFDNATNQTLLSTLDNWGFANARGEASVSPGRQVGMMSDANGQGGTQGLAYNFIGQSNLRAAVAWFAGDLETPTDPMSLAQSDLQSLSARIGHGTTASQTRWLIRIDNDGTDNWFVSREAYQMETAVANAAAFETGNIEISANFSALTWLPLLNGTDQFDGLINAASSGFTVITNAANPAATTLPAGNITAVGMYHWHSANNTATRFDDFTITAIPEPSTYAALIGLLALGFVAYRRRR